MNAKEITRMFAPWREKHARAAWKPVTTAKAPAGVHSRFGGSPAASAEAWPICKGCDLPMRFLLQLACSELPKAAGYPIRSGLVQLFYCSSDDGSCETWAPFSGTHHIRVISTAKTLAAAPPGVEVFPKKTITKWSRTLDYPHPEEHEALGLEYDYDFKKDVVDVRCEDLGLELRGVPQDLDVAEAIASPHTGDKLSGWPSWVQSAEYPDCPQCKTQMRLLLQVDSNDHLPYMFGDVGCAHLTYCPNHPEIGAFGWACS